jgi:hypothetical protein
MIPDGPERAASTTSSSISTTPARLNPTASALARLDVMGCTVTVEVSGIR